MPLKNAYLQLLSQRLSLTLALVTLPFYIQTHAANPIWLFEDVSGSKSAQEVMNNPQWFQGTTGTAHRPRIDWLVSL